MANGALAGWEGECRKPQTPNRVPPVLEERAVAFHWASQASRDSPSPWHLTRLKCLSLVAGVAMPLAPESQERDEGHLRPSRATELLLSRTAP